MAEGRRSTSPTSRECTQKGGGGSIEPPSVSFHHPDGGTTRARWRRFWHAPCTFGQLCFRVCVNVNVNVNVNELRLGFSNTTRNPEGILSHNNMCASWASKLAERSVLHDAYPRRRCMFVEPCVAVWPCCRQAPAGSLTPPASASCPRWNKWQYRPSAPSLRWCVCVFMCDYVYMYQWLCVIMCVCACVCVGIRVRVRVCARTCAWAFVYVCVRVCP